MLMDLPAFNNDLPGVVIARRPQPVIKQNVLIDRDQRFCSTPPPCAPPRCPGEIISSAWAISAIAWCNVLNGFITTSGGSGMRISRR